MAAFTVIGEALSISITPSLSLSGDVSVGFLLLRKFRWLTAASWQVQVQVEAVRESRHQETAWCGYSNMFVHSGHRPAVCSNEGRVVTRRK
jgi:hypothetical protein